MQDINTPVLVVGSGPAGLLAALALLKNGIDVRIIEKKSAYAIGQRGAGVHVRSLEVFHFMGILEEIRKRAIGPPTVKLFAPPPNEFKVLKEVNAVPTLEPTPDIPYPNPVLFGQNGLEDILRKHLTQHDCHVELNTELRSFEQFEDHVAAVIVKRNENNEEIEETVKFRWLIGADGAHSTVRKLLGLSFIGEAREDTSVQVVVGDIHVKNDVLSKDTYYRWGTPDKSTVGFRPTDQDKIFNFWLGGPDIQDRASSMTRQDLLDIFHKTAGRHDVEFGDLVWIGNWRPNIRMVDRYGKGRIFVLGDAAHVHPPLGGQGMNTSIQDAFNLAWKLSLVEKGYSPISLLESLSDERIPVIAEMLKLTTKVLGLLVKGDTDNYWKRDGSMNMLGINYRGSPIVVDEGAPLGGVGSSYEASTEDGVRAGDRAPDAPGLITKDGKETRLFDIFKPTRHVILIFADDYLPFVEALRPYPKGTLLPIAVRQDGTHLDDIESILDRDGHAAKGYNVAEKGWKAVVIRPDSVIGGVLTSVEGLKKYFGKIFV